MQQILQIKWKAFSGNILNKITPKNMKKVENKTETTGIFFLLVLLKNFGAKLFACRLYAILLELKIPLLQAEIEAVRTTKFIIAAADFNPTFSNAITKGLSFGLILFQGNKTIITNKEPM